MDNLIEEAEKPLQRPFVMTDDNKILVDVELYADLVDRLKAADEVVDAAKKFDRFGSTGNQYKLHIALAKYNGEGE